MKSASFLLAPLLVLLAACSTDPKVICKKYVDNANKYFDRGKFQEASILYRRALNKDPRYADAWYHLGLTNIKLSLFAEARKDFIRDLEMDAGNRDAPVQLGNIDLTFYLLDPHANRALLAELKEITGQMLKKDPASYDGLRFAGHIALLEKDRKTAIQEFQKANLAKPGEPELVLSLVETLLADHQFGEAEQLAQQLIEKQKAYSPIYDLLYLHYLRTNRLELAEELLRTKVSNNPSDGGPLLQLAFHYYMTSRREPMVATVARLTSDPKTFPDGRLLAGDFYLRIRDLDVALQQYDQGQKDDPKRRIVYLKKMVEVLGTQGRNVEADRLVAELLKKDPKDPETIALHATLLLQTGDQRQAKTIIAELRPLVSKMPNNATLHYNLGRACMLAGDQRNKDQALAQFQEALKIDPRYMPAQLSLAELELMRGQPVQAVGNAGDVLRADQTNLAARLIRAAGLLSMSELEKAREDLVTALKMYPASNEARFSLAQLDFRERRYHDAESGFLILLQANDPRGLAGVVESKAARGQWDQAVAFVTDQLRRSPDRSEYRLALARIDFRAGKYPEATIEFQRLVDQDPGSASLRVGLGEAKLQSKDPQGALAAFQKAHELAPNDAAPHMDMALVYERTDRYDSARKEYENAIKIQPDNPTALNNLAYLEADQGVDLDQAFAYAQRAREKLPYDFNVQDTLGLIYLKKNLTDDGLRVLRDLVSRKPDNATFHLHLALAWYQKGDRPMARRELDAALRNKPSAKDQGKIKELLAKVG